MDIREKLKKMLDERGWTEYRLTKECGLSESTIANIYRRNSTPSFTTLETICKAFGLKVEKDRQRKKTQLTMQMDRLKADNLRLYEAYSAGHMTKTEYLAEKNAVAEKLTTLQEQIEQLFSELPGAVSVNKEIHNMFSKTNLFDSETELTRELVEAFIDHIYVGENKKLEIHYKSEDALRKLLAEFNMQVP